MWSLQKNSCSGSQLLCQREEPHFCEGVIWGPSQLPETEVTGPKGSQSVLLTRPIHVPTMGRKWPGRGLHLETSVDEKALLRFRWHRAGDAFLPPPVGTWREPYGLETKFFRGGLVKQRPKCTVALSSKRCMVARSFAGPNQKWTEQNKTRLKLEAVLPKGPNTPKNKDSSPPSKTPTKKQHFHRATLA